MKMKPSHHLSDLEYRIDPENEGAVLGYAYAIAGASFAGILALSCISDLSCWLRLALWAFSISLPAAWTFALFLRHVAAGGWSTRPSRILSVAIGLLVYSSGWVGVAALVLHISDIAGIVFLSLSALGVVFGMSFARRHHTTCARLDESNPL